MASSLSSTLSSMEVMLDALMQRGIGKPEEQKQKEEAPPALPTRPTVRGRPPSLQRPGAASPWVQRAPMPLALLPPPQVSYHHSGSPVLGFQEEEHKCLVNLELERRAAKAEEQVKQKDEEVRQKEDEIASLRRQVEHYESRLSECEGRMKSVEDGLQKQITSLQATATTAAQTAGARRSGSTTGSQHHRQDEASTRRQCGSEPTAAVADKVQTAVGQLAAKFQRERAAFEHGDPRSVDELKTLKRLHKTRAELKKQLAHAEKSQQQGHRRCGGWWRIKMPRCRAPKRCTIKFPTPPRSCSFCCCFRRRR